MATTRDRHLDLIRSALWAPVSEEEAGRLLQVIEYLTREAKAEAWDEGYGVGASGFGNRLNLDLNPYRD